MWKSKLQQPSASASEEGDYPSPLTLTIFFNLFLLNNFDLRLASETVFIQNSADFSAMLKDVVTWLTHSHSLLVPTCTNSNLHHSVWKQFFWQAEGQNYWAKKDWRKWWGLREKDNPLLLQYFSLLHWFRPESAGIQEFRRNPIHSLFTQKKNYTTENRSIIYKRNYHKRNK